MRKLFTSLFLIGILFNTFAQKEANIWYFGNQAGIDFNPVTPVPLINGVMSTMEGCASIANKNTGQLLFYTDGITVWNKNHLVMPNGNGLMGEPSSTQSAVIVPGPGSNDTLFYIFTVDDLAGPNGLRYSVVNMNLNMGLGDIILSSKNTLLETPVTEKITAIRHANKQDIWVISHRWNSDQFMAYLVTPSGLNTIPVVSSVGNVHSGVQVNAIGYLKGSPDGSRLALAVFSPGNFV